MNLKRKILLALTSCVLVLLYSANVWAAVSTYDPGKGNPKIISNSKSWATNDKLKTVYEELSKNYHSNEWGALESVILEPGNASAGEVAGYHLFKYTKTNDKLTPSNENIIYIYNCDDLTTIDAIAKTLSHEYGHHYFSYNLMVKENLSPDEWKKSSYAKARGLIDNKQVIFTSSDPNYSHKWCINEIGAEDYVQLLGSPKARSFVEFPDITTRLVRNIDKVVYDTSNYNVSPQENIDIPLATNVAGLNNYMYSLTGGKVLKSPQTGTVPTIEGVTSTAVGKSKQYKLKWSEGTISGNRTVLMFPETSSASEAVLPQPLGSSVKPLNGELVFGAATVKTGNKTAVLSETITGKQKLVVCIVDSNGYAYMSKPYYISFN